MSDNRLNKISTIRVLNEFTNERYLDIVIDGKLLGDLLQENYPGENMSGLVPTLLSWLDNEKERLVTWDRIIPKENEHVISPLLMCGEDIDFWCTVIVAESIGTSGTITWKRIGTDETSDRGLHPEHTGQKVNWLNKIGPFIFDRQEYVNCIEQFRQDLNKDK